MMGPPWSSPRSSWPAATGERFKGGAPKQLAPLNGRAMLAWSARVLAESPRVARSSW